MPALEDGPPSPWRRKSLTLLGLACFIIIVLGSIDLFRLEQQLERRQIWLLRLSNIQVELETLRQGQFSNILDSPLSHLQSLTYEIGAAAVNERFQEIRAEEIATLTTELRERLQRSQLALPVQYPDNLQALEEKRAIQTQLTQLRRLVHADTLQLMDRRRHERRLLIGSLSLFILLYLFQRALNRPHLSAHKAQEKTAVLPEGFTTSVDLQHVLEEPQLALSGLTRVHQNQALSANQSALAATVVRPFTFSSGSQSSAKAKSTGAGLTGGPALRSNLMSAVQSLMPDAASRGILLSSQASEMPPLGAEREGQLLTAVQNLLEHAQRIGSAGSLEITTSLHPKEAPTAIHIKVERAPDLKKSLNDPLNGGRSHWTMAQYWAQMAQVSLQAKEEHGLYRYLMIAPIEVRRRKFFNPVEMSVVKATPHPSATLKRPIALLVDDNHINRQVAGRLLQLEALSVLEAENGIQALELVQTYRPDLILLDLQMPQMDGLTVLRRLKAMGPPASAIPIIALTALDIPESREQCLGAGCVDYIVKPLDSARLRQAIRLATQRKNPPSMGPGSTEGGSGDKEHGHPPAQGAFRVSTTQNGAQEGGAPAGEAQDDGARVDGADEPGPRDGLMVGVPKEPHSSDRATGPGVLEAGDSPQNPGADNGAAVERDGQSTPPSGGAALDDIGVLDDRVYDRLALLAGDQPAFMLDIVRAYLTQIPSRLQNLGEALSAKDFEGLERSAHSLKGSSSSLGLVGVAEICRKLESSAQGNRLKDAQDAYQEIGGALDAAKRALLEKTRALCPDFGHEFVTDDEENSEKRV